MLKQRSIFIAIIAILLAPLLTLLGAFELIDLRTLDAAFVLRGQRPADDEILIVAVDDESLRETGLQWPWPRAYLAEVIEGISAGNPRVIVLDIFFYEQDPDPAGDAALAAAIARAGNVILVNDLLREIRLDLGIEIERYNEPLPILNDAAATVALANIETDNDTFVRRSPAFLVREGDGRAYFSWPVTALAYYWNVPLPDSVRPNRITLGGQDIPLNNGYLNINFRGSPSTFRRIPAYQIPINDHPPETFTDKIVLIGTTSISLRDVYPTPFDGSRLPMPGVEVQANALSTMLNGDFIHHIDVRVLALVTLVLAVAGYLLSRLSSLSLGLIGTGGMFVFLLIAWAVLFLYFNVHISVIGPLLAVAIGFGAPAIDRAAAEQAARRRLRERFELFVPPEVIENILDDVDALGGRRTELTILFSDIRGFTTMAEALPPEELVSILNEYLAEMTELVFKHGGTIDKYEGDAILAFWGAPVKHPDDAIRAVNCALEMREALHLLRDRWGRSGFDIGIGINTGEAFVGTIGSSRRISYTCIGDAVNLASRLQDLTKEVGAPIIISESTLGAIERASFATEPIEARRVKGRVQPVQLYAVTGYQGPHPSDARSLTPEEALT